MDGKLKFQVGNEAPRTILGRAELVKASGDTIGPCKTVYPINGQQVVDFNEGGTEK